ncbi:uncharacterized protein KIAA2013 homolog [Amphiura filiformis]|uniref:uncharacterized protein KIAA2013 homolog n=1 Tax=Amphiura filiformis TaxID=82378 RepID=UPI003B215371
MTQMLNNNFMRNLLGAINAPKGRKVCLAIFIGLVFFGYLGPWVINHGKATQITVECLEVVLKDYDRKYAENEYLIHQSPKSLEEQVHPFVGNGNIGFTVNYFYPAGLILRLGSSWTKDVPYRPMVRARLESLNDQSASIINYKNGMVERLQCYSIDGACVLMSLKTFVHRTRHSLLLQEIKVENKANTPVTLKMERNGPYYWKGSATSTEILEVEGNPHEYTLSSGKFKAPYERDRTGEYFVAMVIAATNFAKEVTIPPGTVHTEQVIAVVKFSQPFLDAHKENDISAELVDKTEEELFSLLHMDFNILMQEHVETWSQHIWSSKMWLEPLNLLQEDQPKKSHPPLPVLLQPQLSPQLVVATVYYVLSSVDAPLFLPSTSQLTKKEMYSALKMPGSCFNGQPTIFEENLWKPIDNTADMSDLVSHWQHTLFKHGCRSLLNLGVTGFMQAMMLSLLGAQFHEYELAFHADPTQIHTKVQIHNLLYNASFVDIDVDPSSESREIGLSITTSEAIKQSSQPLLVFACGAGCESEPIELNSERQVVDLKWTDPQTPVLYFSHDRKHLSFMKKSIIHYKHIRWVDDVPHEEGQHHHGLNLPVAFWVIIIGLIFGFHLFLFKLIYQEYCVGGGSRSSEKYRRGKDGNNSKV